jgi:hypothetical protein
MVRVIVRNLDEQVASSLKFKAELRGHSLEQESGTARHPKTGRGADHGGEARPGRAHPGEAEAAVGGRQHRPDSRRPRLALMLVSQRLAHRSVG